MKLIGLLTTLAATACLVSCGQKSNTNNNNTSAPADTLKEAPATQPETISSPWVFDGNKVISKIEVSSKDDNALYEYQYDSKGRMTKSTSVTWEGTIIAERDYSTMTGSFSETSDGNTNTWTSTFNVDHNGRITHEKSSNGDETTCQFNDKGQLTLILGSQNDTTYYNWDDKDLLSNTTIFGYSLTFSYSDTPNSLHQPFFIPDSKVALERTSVISRFPSAIQGDGWSVELQYEFNQDGTIDKINCQSVRLGQKTDSATIKYSYSTL